MRDWPNPVFAGTLEEACAASEHGPYVLRVGFEVEGIDERAGEHHVLLPAYDPGLPPWTGEMARCSSLAFNALWRVGRVAKGYPGAMLIGRYPDDFPEDLR
jgi:hypothetical protein